MFFKIMLWINIIFMAVVGFIFIYQGKPLPPPNVFTVASSFIWIYYIVEEKKN